MSMIAPTRAHTCFVEHSFHNRRPSLPDAPLLNTLPSQLRAFQDRMFCGIAKPFGIPQIGLLLCFEDKDASTCDPLVNSYRVCADYCKQESIGEVVVNGVYEKGAIAGNPGLRQAYDLGASIS